MGLLGIILVFGLGTYCFYVSLTYTKHKRLWLGQLRMLLIDQHMATEALLMAFHKEPRMSDAEYIELENNYDLSRKAIQKHLWSL